MKRVLAFVFAAVMLFALLAFAASAQTISVDKAEFVEEFIDKANTEKKAYLAELKDEKDLAKVEDMVLKTNEKILAMVYKEMEAKKPDIDKLVAKTDEMALKTIEKAAKMGYEVVCEYVAYEIHGETVLIDPLIVIKK